MRKEIVKSKKNRSQKFLLFTSITVSNSHFDHPIHCQEINEIINGINNNFSPFKFSFELFENFFIFNVQL